MLKLIRRFNDLNSSPNMTFSQNIPFDKKFLLNKFRKPGDENEERVKIMLFWGEKLIRSVFFGIFLLVYRQLASGSWKKCQLRDVPVDGCGTLGRASSERFLNY